MKIILPIIVVSQFLCTSVWFAGNAVLPSLAASQQVPLGFLAHLISAVQFGFIGGTFVFALLSIADRYPPSRVFGISAFVAGFCNLGMIVADISPATMMLTRALTGFFLAGIYPVGMKIASDYYQRGLGKSLGFLVGALVLGTAFPHLLKLFTAGLPWRSVIWATSILSAAGGCAMLLLGDGPGRVASPRFRPAVILHVFRDKGLRAVAFGYFGHMWELYAFWTFVPSMLGGFNRRYPGKLPDVPLWSFIVIASGSLACAASGYLSVAYGSKRIAIGALAASGICCLLSPVLLSTANPPTLLAFLLFWGLVVIADSPMFSTMVAQQAAAAWRGSALTIVNCIGFTITILSIQLLNLLSNSLDEHYRYLLLAIGPACGLAALLRAKRFPGVVGKP